MKDQRIDTSPLNLFRFLAIATVVCLHYGRNIENIYLFPNGLTRAGAIITFFFILSGFGLFLGYQKKDSINLREYFIKRTTRILPFYYMALLMMALILIISGRFSFAEFLLSFFCIQPWFPGYQHSVNPPGWFVANLLFFYCTFPAIFFLIKKKSPSAERLFLSSILLWAVMVILHNYILSGYPEQLYNYIDCSPASWFCSFYMGVCGAYLINSNNEKKYFITTSSPIYTLSILFLCSLIMIIHQGNTAELIEMRIPFEANLYAPILLLMIINLSTARNLITKFFSIRYFGLFATISYPLYILQAPIHGIYSNFISKHMTVQPWIDFTLFFIFFMLIASLLTIIEDNIFKRVHKKNI